MSGWPDGTASAPDGVAAGAGSKTVEAERLRRLFRFFAATQCRGRSAVYEALSEGVAGDDGLLDLLMAAPDEQRRPSLLLAAVSFLLAADPGAALADYYPVHGGQRPVDGQLVSAFAAFCAAHHDELGRLVRTRATQTNEIRRCVALRLGLDYVRRCWPGPVALVEVGASAGLNLLVDRYRYRVGGREVSPAGAGPVLISCDIRGGDPGAEILGPVPEITTRLGIDQQPVSLADPAARAWLQAFIWPEHTADLSVLRAAMDLAIAGAGPAVVPGDAITDTARLLDQLPGREPIVVFTATLFSYLSAGAREAFVAQLRQAAERRPLAWIFAEAPGLIAGTAAATDPGLAALAGPVAHRNSLCLVGAHRLAPGSPGPRRRDDAALLALADPYLRWLAPARHPADDFPWLPATLGPG